MVPQQYQQLHSEKVFLLFFNCGTIYPSMNLFKSLIVYSTLIFLLLPNLVFASDFEGCPFFGILRCNTEGVVWSSTSTYNEEMTASVQNAVRYIGDITGFLYESVLPLLLAIALVAFLWNVMRYFFASDPTPENRSAGKRLILYSFLAFVIIASLWGIIAFLIKGFGFNYYGSHSIHSDYILRDYILR